MILNMDAFTRRILKIYKNYGLDTSNMTDEELDAVKRHYRGNKEELVKDIKSSEAFIKEFEDKII